MRVRIVSLEFLFTALLVTASFAAAHDYQAGKIIKIETQASHSPSGGSDAPSQAEATTNNVSIQLGGTIYLCRYKTSAERDLSWAEGKDVQARVSGKTIYVQTATGKEVKGSILSTSPATNP